MPTAFEDFVNAELPNRVASTASSQTANSIPRYTGTAKLTEERTPAQVLSDIGGAAAVHGHVEADITDLDHTDVDAIHDNVASEISAVTNKPEAVAGDLLLIEDSEAANVKKHLLVSGLPLLGFFNGTFMEPFDATLVQNGTEVDIQLEATGGGDLTQNWSDGQATLDCTPIKVAQITKGTDTVPVDNYVYILQSAKTVLAHSTSGWPTTEHIKVAYCLVPSPGTVNLTGPYINQNWNEMIGGGTNNQGHLTHITEYLRHSGAIWISGCQGLVTIDTAETPDAAWVSVAAGFISQLHHHNFPALDSDTAGAGDTALVVNDSVTPFNPINNLTDITADSTGATIGNNKYFTVVLWGVANKMGTFSPMMLNLPSGVYNSLSGAQSDVDNHANFSIPHAFNLDSSTGFLIAKFIFKRATNITLEDTVDLRGQTPNTASGSGTGGGDVTAAAAMTDNAMVRGDGGAKGVQDSGIIIDDSDNVTGMGLLNTRNLATDAAVLDALAAAAVLNLAFDAHTILQATVDNTPLPLTVAEQTLVGRITSGNIDALTATEVRTLLNVEDGAAVNAKWHRSLRIPNPKAADAFPVLYFPAAATITRIHAERQAGTSVTFNFEERAEGSYFSAGTDVFLGDEVLTANETWTAFNNASMAANSILTYAASVVTGAVTDLVLTLEGTWD